MEDHNRKCRFCSEPLNQSFADLGMSPMANEIIKPADMHKMEAFYPLHAYVCNNCHLVQLEEFESPDHIFSDYSYFSSFSESWLANTKKYADYMTERFAINKDWHVVEIASNDGYLLKNFVENGVPVTGVEPAGKGLDTDQHAATLTLGTKGAIHGFECYNLQDKEGNPLPVYSIASGLDYPGVGPQHCYLKDIKRVEYEAIDDKECLDAFMQLSRLEGIIPALESAHAIAHAMKIAKDMSPDKTILVNLSGRGDKDADFVADYLSL